VTPHYIGWIGHKLISESSSTQSRTSSESSVFVQRTTKEVIIFCNSMTSKWLTFTVNHDISAVISTAFNVEAVKFTITLIVLAPLVLLQTSNFMQHKTYLNVKVSYKYTHLLNRWAKKAFTDHHYSDWIKSNFGFTS
jgi:hypothetical protein